MSKTSILITFFILFVCYQSFSQVNPNSPLEKYDDTPLTKELALKLTNGLPNDSLKVLAIYDWIIENISSDSLLYAKMENPLHWRNFEMSKDNRQIKPIQSCSEILATKKAISLGYAYLFSAMCDAAGIKNAVIKGYARLDSISISTPNHIWVSFKLSDKWYLADPTWDAGISNSEQYKNFAKENHVFLMLNPKVFLNTHFPLDPLWQLQNAPVSLKNWNLFIDNVNPTEQYFNYTDSLKKYEAYDVERRFLTSINRITKANDYALFGHQEYCRFLFKPLSEDIMYYDNLNRQLNNGNKSIQEMADKILPRKKELFDRLSRIESNIKIFRYHATKLAQIPDAFKGQVSERDFSTGLANIKRYNDYLISERASLEATIKELEPYQRKKPTKK